MAPIQRSAGADVATLRRCRRASAAITHRNVSAFSANTAAGPASATMTPPSAGPSERARFIETPPSVTAAGREELGTASAVSACQSGSSSADPTPIASAKPMSSCGRSAPSAARHAIKPAQMQSQICAPMASLFRSTMSASAPAGSATTKNAAPSTA